MGASHSLPNSLRRWAAAREKKNLDATPLLQAADEIDTLRDRVAQLERERNLLTKHHGR